jgi:RNA polymerase sigma factor (sigma-70 family)
MAQGTSTLLDRLRVVLRPAGPPADADLLRHYTATRDGESFAILVRRHGPMVWGVCRRVLRVPADAEDAFQATFLVLARKAAAVRPASALANWLHGVAYRTAMEARRAAAVRLKKERHAAELAPTPEPPDPDLREALDRAIAALPELYRVAVVVCDLEGLTRKEAAARLSWTEGEVAGRLTRGRALLARRLSRCGLCVPAAGLATGPTIAAVPGELVRSTVRIATLVNTEGACVAPAHLTCLTEGVMKTMLLTKVKAVAASLVLGCAVLATAVGTWQANATGAAAGERKTGRDADKERIAELERERERLLKKIGELTARLDKLEEEKKVFQYNHLLSRNLYLNNSDAINPSLNYLDYAARVGNNANSPLLLRQALLFGPNTTNTMNRTNTTNTTPVLRVYPADGLAATQKEAEALIRVVQKTVEPDSWVGAGGQGVVEYLPSKQVLVVRHTPAAHEKVAELLKLLQKSAEPSKPAGK